MEDAGHDTVSARLVAELPWLRIGTHAQLELDDGTRRGRIDWIGLEPSKDGVARLSLRVSFERARPESTLPYFSTRDMQQLRVEEAHPVEALVEESRKWRSMWPVGLASFALLVLIGLAFG